MQKLEMSINAGIGDNLMVRVFFDSIKHNYDQIIISHNKEIIDYWKDGDPKYYQFLNEFGSMLFTTTPYVFSRCLQFPPMNLHDGAHSIKTLNLVARKPDLDHILCQGSSLNLGEEYIVITTKIRGIERREFFAQSIHMWRALRELSKKYKIVILGERTVETSKEYGNNRNIIYGIYEQIIANLPQDRVVDLTVPALGITVPNIDSIKQDCLIMKQAKFVITLAVGGNLWLAISVANTIGFRADNGVVNNYLNDLISNTEYPSVFLTQDWSAFIKKLEMYK